MTLLQEENQMQDLVNFIEYNPKEKVNRLIEQAVRINQKYYPQKKKT